MAGTDGVTSDHPENFGHLASGNRVGRDYDHRSTSLYGSRFSTKSRSRSTDTNSRASPATQAPTATRTHHGSADSRRRASANSYSPAASNTATPRERSNQPI